MKKLWLVSLFVWTLIPIILLILPATYFDTGGIKCLITLATGQNCYGCGMTRAIMHLGHLNFREAWEYNKLSYIVFPLLAYVYVETWLDLFKKYKNQF